MADITAFSCHVCGRNPSDGVNVFRINATGQKGVWACTEHNRGVAPVIEAMVNDLEAAKSMNLTARQAGEILGAKVIE